MSRTKARKIVAEWYRWSARYPSFRTEYMSPQRMQRATRRLSAHRVTLSRGHDIVSFDHPVLRLVRLRAHLRHQGGQHAAPAS